jgi:hypothetical protein
MSKHTARHTALRPVFSRVPPRAAQEGVVLFIALVVLVAMMLAGLSLMRSVTSTRVIGVSKPAVHGRLLSPSSISQRISRRRATSPAGTGTSTRSTPQPTGGRRKGNRWRSPVHHSTSQEWMSAGSSIDFARRQISKLTIQASSASPCRARGMARQRERLTIPASRWPTRSSLITGSPYASSTHG